jgi:hypothetical protein
LSTESSEVQGCSCCVKYAIWTPQITTTTTVYLFSTFLSSKKKPFSRFFLSARLPQLKPDLTGNVCPTLQVLSSFPPSASMQERGRRQAPALRKPLLVSDGHVRYHAAPAPVVHSSRFTEKKATDTPLRSGPGQECPGYLLFTRLGRAVNHKWRQMPTSDASPCGSERTVECGHSTAQTPVGIGRPRPIPPTVRARSASVLTQLRTVHSCCCQTPSPDT